MAITTHMEKGIFAKLLEKDGYQLLFTKEFDDHPQISSRAMCSIGSVTRTFTYEDEALRDEVFDSLGMETIDEAIAEVNASLNVQPVKGLNDDKI